MVLTPWGVIEDGPAVVLREYGSYEVPRCRVLKRPLGVDAPDRVRPHHRVYIVSPDHLEGRPVLGLDPHVKVMHVRPKRLREMVYEPIPIPVHPLPDNLAPLPVGRKKVVVRPHALVHLGEHIVKESLVFTRSSMPNRYRALKALSV